MEVLEYLKRTIENNGAVHLTLIDPDEQEPDSAGDIAEIVAKRGTDGIMVGGSTHAGGRLLDETVTQIKERADLPVILFPASESGVSKYADAIFFMSLLNSEDPYYITGAQYLGASKVKKYSLEPISMGYLVIEPGGSAGQVGKANLIRRNDFKSAVGYALAAQYLGMDVVYLEAGSGVNDPVSPQMVAKVAEQVDIMLAVGGGIRTPNVAADLVEAGAEIVVTGTLVERSINMADKVGQIVESIKVKEI